MTWTLAVAIAASLALTPLARRMLLRFDVLDRPNVRSSHRTVTARGGGLAVMAGAVVAIAVAPVDVDLPVVGLVGAAVVLGAIGFADDRVGLSPVLRLGAQLVVPAVAFPLLVDGDLAGGVTGPLLAAVAVLWSAGYVNAFNFMDGINGISVVQAVAAGIAFAVLGEWHDLPVITAGGLAIAGAGIGFAPFNVWRASIFLGDVGSYFIGSWLASLLILAIHGGVAPVVAISPFLLYLADTTTTILRRARRGERLMSAHREHAYQLLVQRGWPHVAVSVLVAAIIGLTTAGVLATESASTGARVAAFAGALAIVVGFVALPATLNRRSPSPVA